MTTVIVDGQGQNEKVCSQQCHHQKINDGERLHEKVVTMVDLCLIYTTGPISSVEPWRGGRGN
jgi:hypothetical protein